MKVLVFDIDDALFNIIKFTLQRHADIKVDRAGSWSQAIASLQNANFNLVITDISLPKHTGIDLIRFVRENFNIEIPVLGLIDGYHESVVDKTNRLAISEFIFKPINPLEFYNQVIKYL